MNTIEPSKSGRASCRTCKNKIDKGKARLGVETEFHMGGEIVTSIKWHHLKCGFDKLPEEIMKAEIVNKVTSRGKSISLTEEDINAIEEFIKENNKSGVAIQKISEIDLPNKIVNIKAKILRSMSASTRENVNGEPEWSRTVYVIDEDGIRSRISLWGKNAEIELHKDDNIVVLEALSYLGSNEKIQFNSTSNSTVLVNPTENDLEKHNDGIELYISSAWERPTGDPAEFTIAPSGRASCGVCEKKIEKGILKIIKPEFIEIERNGKTMKVKRDISFHIECIIEDEHGEEVLREATTRLTLDQISKERQNLEDLTKLLPDISAKKILKKLL